MGVASSCLSPTVTGGNTSPGSGGGLGMCCHAEGMCHDTRSVSVAQDDRRMRSGAVPWDVPEQFALLPGLPPSCCTTTAVQLETRFCTADEARKAARQFGKEHKIHQAFAAYAAALELEEEDPQLYDEIGQFLFSHSQLEGAEHMFERALALDPLNPEYFYRRGVVLQQQRQPLKAIQCFAAALAHQPLFIGALFNLGVAHRDLGDHKGAAEDFKRILQLDDKNIDAMVLLAECLCETGDLDGAVRSLEAALKLDPSNRAALRDLKRVNGLQSKIESA